LKQKVPVPTVTATTSSRFYGASVALSRNGETGIVGVPRALGKSGFMTTGMAFRLCLPQPLSTSDDDLGDAGSILNYTCPNLDLPHLSWTSSAFWFSWDSWSGKLLALVATIALCLCILFYEHNQRRPGQQDRRRQERHRFERVPDNDDYEYDNIELRVIQEEMEGF